MRAVIQRAIQAPPPNLDNDTCRTTEMWFKLIQPGSFIMGSPSSELGRVSDDETQRSVSLSKPFYMSVFQVTQRQYELVMGNSGGQNVNLGSTRPQLAPYTTLRGFQENAGTAPTAGQAASSSFMGRLAARISQKADLPTEAQWEYACRAGTGTALNSGKDLTATSGQCPNLSEVGRYRGNATDGKGGYSSGSTKVGMYLPNAWGLYDMHGNAWEFCLDFFRKNGSVMYTYGTDPRGPSQSDYINVLPSDPYGHWVTSLKVARGYHDSSGTSSALGYCRSAGRTWAMQNTFLGIRVECDQDT